VAARLAAAGATVCATDRSQEALDGVREQLGDEELAELCLDVAKWSTQKVHVALGTDGAERLPLNEQGVSFFSFDDAGRVAGFSADVHR